MRNAFAKEITEIAGRRDDLVLLSGDIGNRLFDDFKVQAPGRFLNCGIAEANMVGVAAGMAQAGLRPVCYTIAPFITYRVIEQIRVDACYHQLPVVFVGTGAGLSYASLGGTHQSCEDMGMLRLLPGMTVMAPADSWELQACLRIALVLSGPSYLRIGKKGEPCVHASVPPIEVGKALHIGGAGTVELLCAGTLLPAACKVQELLAEAGVPSGLHSMPFIKPLDVQCLDRVFSHASLVVTIEEHSVLGGLGGAVAEWRSEQAGAMGRLLRIGTPDAFPHKTADQEQAHEDLGLSAHQITTRILSSLVRP